MFATVTDMLRSGAPFGRIPQFKVGDKVFVAISGPERGKQGVVVHVTDHAGDFVHRYDVGFPDGTLKRYFGFEIDFLVESA
jgi:hypothetical protein